MNKVIMMGNLSKDVELRYAPSGSAIATTSIAVSRKFKKQDGSQGEEVCFIDLVFFGRSGEIANQYLSKGKKVLIEGRLKLDQWTDQQGVKRSKHSITVESLQMMDSRQDSANEHQQSRPNVSVRTPDGKIHDIPDIDINGDEIPF